VNNKQQTNSLFGLFLPSAKAYDDDDDLQNYEDEPKRNVGRPKKNKNENKNARMPTEYNHFIGEQMCNMSDNIPGKERFKECARRWNQFKS
jgi:hypothetical protein